MSDLTLEGQGRIMPFYAVDPRAPDPVESVKKAIESQGFVGVKLYSPMGYKPIGNDDREIKENLKKPYECCCKIENNPISITAQCSWSAGCYSNKPMTRDPKIDLKTYYRDMAAPFHWENVLDEFSSLKLNLAHFRGMGAWEALAKGENPRKQ